MRLVCCIRSADWEQDTFRLPLLVAVAAAWQRCLPVVPLLRDLPILACAWLLIEQMFPCSLLFLWQWCSWPHL